MVSMMGAEQNRHKTQSYKTTYSLLQHLLSTDRLLYFPKRISQRANFDSISYAK